MKQYWKHLRNEQRRQYNKRRYTKGISEQIMEDFR